MYVYLLVNVNYTFIQFFLLELPFFIFVDFFDIDDDLPADFFFEEAFFVFETGFLTEDFLGLTLFFFFTDFFLLLDFFFFDVLNSPLPWGYSLDKSP
jgi:hypothetical protein